MLHRRGSVASQEGAAGYTGVPGCLHGWSFWNRQKGEAELRVGLGVVGGRSEPFSQKLSLSILLFVINRKHPKWPGAIQRKEAWIWIVTFVAYTLLMFYQETH